jgi:hypothetical protein
VNESNIAGDAENKTPPVFGKANFVIVKINCNHCRKSYTKKVFLSWAGKRIESSCPKCYSPVFHKWSKKALGGMK